jgi:hypothetical protein
VKTENIQVRNRAPHVSYKTSLPHPNEPTHAPFVSGGVVSR